MSLFEQRERLVLDRDSLEFVWGFGRLRWEAAATGRADRVDHPMITVTVEVDLGPRTPSRSGVRPAGGAPEVEGRYLHRLDIHDLHRLHRAMPRDRGSRRRRCLVRRDGRPVEASRPLNRRQGNLIDKATGRRRARGRRRSTGFSSCGGACQIRRGSSTRCVPSTVRDHPIPEPLRGSGGPLGAPVQRTPRGGLRPTAKSTEARGALLGGITPAPAGQQRGAGPDPGERPATSRCRSAGSARDRQVGHTHRRT